MVIIMVATRNQLSNKYNCATEWKINLQFVVCNHFKKFHQGKITMKSLIGQSRYFESMLSKIVITITLVTTLSFLSMASAFADRDNGHGRGNRQNKQNFRQWRNDDEGYGYRQSYGYRYRQPHYNYAQPVYVPPPVYYGPMQAPGINLVFPLNLRHR